MNRELWKAEVLKALEALREAHEEAAARWIEFDQSEPGTPDEGIARQKRLDALKDEHVRVARLLEAAEVEEE